MHMPASHHVSNQGREGSNEKAAIEEAARMNAVVEAAVAAPFLQVLARTNLQSGKPQSAPCNSHQLITPINSVLDHMSKRVSAPNCSSQLAHPMLRATKLLMSATCQSRVSSSWRCSKQECNTQKRRIETTELASDILRQRASRCLAVPKQQQHRTLSSSHHWDCSLTTDVSNARAMCVLGLLTSTIDQITQF